MKKMSRRFYLEHDVEVNGKRIKMLGIHHGQIPIAPIGRKTRRFILDKHHKNPQAAIYAENVSRAYLPGKLTRKAKELDEGSLQDDLSSKKVARLVKWRVFPAITAATLIVSPYLYMRELVGLPIEMKPSEYSEKTLRETWKKYKPFFKRGTSTAEQREIINYLIVYMSAKMADRLAAAPEQNIIAVMGASHIALVRRFLENSRLRQRYLRISERKLSIS